MQSPGEPDLVQSLVAQFLAEADAHIEQMRLACEQSNRRQLEETAHRFYTSCSNLGLIRMSRVCTSLEAIARQGLPDCPALIEQLRDAYVKIKPKLSGLR